MYIIVEHNGNTIPIANENYNAETNSALDRKFKKMRENILFSSHLGTTLDKEKINITSCQLILKCRDIQAWMSESMLTKLQGKREGERP